MTKPSQIATPERVREGVESLLAEGKPLREITLKAVRERVGGGGMRTIHKHLRPVVEEKRAHGEGVPACGPDDGTAAVEALPAKALDLIGRVKGTADELGTLARKLIDEGAAEERRRYEEERRRQREVHDHEREQTAAEVAALRDALDQTAEESAAVEQELENAKEEVRRRQQRCEDESARADALEGELGQVRSHVAVTETEACERAQRVADLEARVQQAEAARTEAEG